MKRRRWCTAKFVRMKCTEAAHRCPICSFLHAVHMHSTGSASSHFEVVLNWHFYCIPWALCYTLKAASFVYVRFPGHLIHIYLEFRGNSQLFPTNFFKNNLHSNRTVRYKQFCVWITVAYIDIQAGWIYILIKFNFSCDSN